MQVSSDHRESCLQESLRGVTEAKNKTFFKPFRDDTYPDPELDLTVIIKALPCAMLSIPSSVVNKTLMSSRKTFLTPKYRQ